MVSPYGIDLGGILRNVEAVKGAKQNREHNALNMEWKKEDRELARSRTNALAGLRGAAAGGDKEAVTQLIAFDPKEAEQLISSISKMNESERADAKYNIEQVGSMLAGVLTSENPEQAYQAARQSLSPEMMTNVPEQYDPNFVQMQLARARDIDKTLENPKQITFGDQDRLYKNGRVVESTTSSAERDRQNSRGNALLKNQGGAGGMKSADSGQIYKQSVAMFGGFVDPVTNETTGLSKSSAGEAQAVAAEASRLYSTGEASNHADAVAKAARKLGIQVQDLGAGGNMDRNALLQQYSQ